MPFAPDLLQRGLRAELNDYMKRARHPRPAGRARVLHLLMQPALQRGPTPDEVLEFGHGYKRKAEARDEAAS